MTRLGTRIGAGSLGGILALAGCGPPFTTATGGGGTGSAGGSTTTTTTSASGTTGSSSSGGPCTPGMINTCGPGSFCNDKQTCAPCSTAGLGYGTPVPVVLAGSPPSGTVGSFPRVADDGTLYFIELGKSPPSGQIASAPMMSSTVQASWGMPTVLPPPFNPMASAGQDAPQQEGPLPWAKGGPIAPLVNTSDVFVQDPVLLFGSTVSGSFKVWAATNSKDDPTPKPDQLNLPDGLNDKSIAVSFTAQGGPRYYWLRDGALVMVTGGSGVPFVPVVITFEDACFTAIADPWVGPDGKHLFFTGGTGGSGCLPAGSSQTRLFHVPLDPATGLPPAGAKAAQLFPNDTTDDDRTPSLSPDGCLLLFARGNATSTTTTLYAALRE